MLAAFVLAALTDAEIIRGFVNLARLNRIGAALHYRQIQYGNLNIGESLHQHAVALQLRDEELIDPWETPYRIAINGNHFRVTGAGADRKFSPDCDTIVGPVRTTSLDADVIYIDDHTAQHNYTWLFRQVGKPLTGAPGLYSVPQFEPIHRRTPNALPASPEDARVFEIEAEHAAVFPRYYDLDVLRAMQTRASMQLLAARLDAWLKTHGSFAAVDYAGVLQKEPWPFNDWLLPMDQWGTPFQIEITDGGKGYKLTSLGADKTKDTESLPATNASIDQVMLNGTFVRAFDPIAYEADLRQRDEEQSRKSTATITLPDGSTVWRVGAGVNPPVAIRRVDPMYPESARRDKIGGLCIVEAIIDENGNVRDAKLLHAESADLGNAALDAIRQWKFKPATRNGTPVRVIYNLTISFNPE